MTHNWKHFISLCTQLQLLIILDVSNLGQSGQISHEGQQNEHQQL